MEVVVAVCGLLLALVMALPKLARTFEDEWRFAGKVIGAIGRLYPFAFGYVAGSYVTLFAHNYTAHGAATAGVVTALWMLSHLMRYVDRGNQNRDTKPEA